MHEQTGGRWRTLLTIGKHAFEHALPLADCGGGDAFGSEDRLSASAGYRPVEIHGGGASIVVGVPARAGRKRTIDDDRTLRGEKTLGVESEDDRLGRGLDGDDGAVVCECDAVGVLRGVEARAGHENRSFHEFETPVTFSLEC